MASAIIAGITAAVTSSAAVVASTAIAVASTTLSVVAMRKAKRLSAHTTTAERQQTLRATTAPTHRIYGQTRRAGLLVFAQEQRGEQTQGEWLHLVLAIAPHRCHRLDAIEVDKRPLSHYGSHIRCTGYEGTQTQADGYLVAHAPDWTSDCVGHNTAYAAVSLRFDPDVFAHGVPNVTFRVWGVPVFDPRDGEHRWSENAALCILDFLRQVMQVPDDEMNMDAFVQAANRCDERVPTENGETEPRYTVNGELSLDVAPVESLAQLLAACAGSLDIIGGQFHLTVGVSSGLPTLTLDEDAIISDITVQGEKEQRNRINSVHGTFVDRSAGFVTTDYPPQHDEAAIEQDKETLKANLDLDLVQSVHQAQRLAAIHLRRERAGFSLQGRLKPGVGAALYLGRCVQVKLATLGIERVCRVTQWSLDMTRGVEVTLVAEDEAIYADNPTQRYTPAPALAWATGWVPAPHALRYQLDTTTDGVQGMLTWQGWPTLHRYDVVIEHANGTVVETATTARAPLNLRPLPDGDYLAHVRAVAASGQRSEPCTHTFTLAPPKPPESVDVVAGVWDITLLPRLTPIPAGTQFEFWLKQGEDWQVITRSGSLTHGGRAPHTPYHYRVRTLSAVGASEWIDITATTRANPEGLDTLVESRVTQSPLIEALSTTVQNTAAQHDALWSVKTDVGDITSGIGLYNDGHQTQCVINAQQFAMIDTHTHRTKTLFKVENGTTYLDNAHIKRANIDGPLIADAIQANTRMSGVSMDSSEINIDEDGRPNNDNFSVSKNGQLTCKNAEISGKIVSSNIQSSRIHGGVVTSAYMITPHIIGAHSSVLSVYNRELYGTMDLYTIVNVLKKEPFVASTALEHTDYAFSYREFNQDGLGKHITNIQNDFVSPYNAPNMDTTHRFANKRVTLQLALQYNIKNASSHHGYYAHTLAINATTAAGTTAFLPSGHFIPASVSARPWHYHSGGTTWTITAHPAASAFTIRGAITLDYQDFLHLHINLNDRDTWGGGYNGFTLKLSVDTAYNVKHVPESHS